MRWCVLEKTHEALLQRYHVLPILEYTDWIKKPITVILNLNNIVSSLTLVINILFQPLLLSATTILNTPVTPDSLEIKLEHNRIIYSLNAVSHNDRTLWLKKINEAQKEVLHNDKCKLQKQQSSKSWASYVVSQKINVEFSMETFVLKFPDYIKKVLELCLPFVCAAPYILGIWIRFD